MKLVEFIGEADYDLVGDSDIPKQVGGWFHVEAKDFADCQDHYLLRQPLPFEYDIGFGDPKVLSIDRLLDELDTALDCIISSDATYEEAKENFIGYVDIYKPTTIISVSDRDGYIRLLFVAPECSTDVALLATSPSSVLRKFAT
jgi:hypothetical protein